MPDKVAGHWHRNGNQDCGASQCQRVQRCTRNIEEVQGQILGEHHISEFIEQATVVQALGQLDTRCPRLLFRHTGNMNQIISNLIRKGADSLLSNQLL